MEERRTDKDPTCWARVGRLFHAGVGAGWGRVSGGGAHMPQGPGRVGRAGFQIPFRPAMCIARQVDNCIVGKVLKNR